MSHFAPQLVIPDGTTDIGFYTNGLGADEMQRWSNDDGTIHVAELQLEGSLFHLHQEGRIYLRPEDKRASVIVGFFTEDVAGLIERAVSAGAELISPATDYDYGYRQGEFRDPFGHIWLVTKKI